jgi:chromate transporter
MPRMRRIAEPLRGREACMRTESTEPAAAPAHPPVPAQARIWLAVGLQSFGGGMATLALIRRGFVEERSWITEEEFTRLWAICQLAPGINLIAFAILIGRRLGGAAGAAAALAGMLLPSAAITVAMTAAYASIRESAQVKAALSAVIPTTVGIGLATAIKMGAPLIAAGRRGGAVRLAAAILILGGSALALGLLRLPIVLVLAESGLAGALSYVILPSTGSAESEEEV